MTAALHFRNAHAKIPDWSCAVGERWTLSAPTGWGKTVWLRQLALLRDTEATSLLWNGSPVTAADASRYRSRWIYVSQFLHRSRETVDGHLASLLSLRVHRQVDAAGFRSRFDEALDALELAGVRRAGRTLDDLSGGELQAVALARSAALAPEGLFLDEPTAAMDGTLRRRAETWLLRRYGGACVWVSHDAEQLKRLSDAGFRPLTP